jgi:hypothetical protein
MNFLNNFYLFNFRIGAAHGKRRRLQAPYTMNELVNAGKKFKKYQLFINFRNHDD